MKNQFLNPQRFLQHRINAELQQKTKNGRMHTDAYQFEIMREERDLDNCRFEQHLSLYESTGECWEFETYYWENGDFDIDFRLQADFSNQNGVIYDFAKSEVMKKFPIVYWVNNQGRQCLVISLFGDNNVIVEFNDKWVRMFHNVAFNHLSMEECADLFDDLSDVGMQDSINRARTALNVIAASNLAFDGWKTPPLY